ncbi:MAG: hypothetical protein NUV86_02530 [Candidatus Scalindua sp.]|nr:hypothetical protein [Candidatus Scalindua sp.]MCR4345449.1 hypothetical protein [Candidatus Scalindua sp.]
MTSPIIPIIFASTLLIEERMPFSSELSPLFPIAITTSSAAVIARSQRLSDSYFIYRDNYKLTG